MILLPLAWMLSTALKADAEIYTNPSFIPRAWAWGNFVKAWTSVPFILYLRNTLIIKVSCMAGTLISSTLAAYGFARIRFRGRDAVFVLALAAPAFGGSAYYSQST